jgi:hypothetical protein
VKLVPVLPEVFELLSAGDAEIVTPDAGYVEFTVRL